MSTATTLSRNPATGEVIGISSVNSKEEVVRAVDRARLVQPEWAGRSVRERAAVIARVQRFITSHADELAELISKNTGKTITEAMSTEVVPSAMAAAYYARVAPGLLRERPLKASSPFLAHKTSRLRRLPIGVLGIISPRNYPFAIPFSEVALGLLAGNAVVLKTATQTQAVGRALERALRAEGLPPGVFSYVNLPGPQAGEAMLAGRVDKILFTGSSHSGRQLLARAAETLTPVALRLGGNDPMLVCADADVDRAVAGALWAGMLNCGQSAGGVERVYVHRNVYQLFINLLAEQVQKLRVGWAEASDPSAFELDMGPMLDPAQAAVVRGQIRDALDRGAVIYGESELPEDSDPNASYLPATVLVKVDHTMRIMKEETFGPVVAVMRVESMDRAVELANDSSMGLTGSVWSRDRRQAEGLAHRIRAGVVMINDHLMGHGLAEVPWGGVSGESGLGRTHGELGFDEVTVPQCIVRDTLPLARRDLWWHPYGAQVYEGMHGILDLLYARQPARRLSGLGRVARLLPRTFVE